jgi:hypothetical protein
LQLDELNSLQKSNCFPVIEAALDQDLDSLDAEVIAQLIDEALHGIALHYLK